MYVLIGFYLFSITLIGFLMWVFETFKIKDFLIIALVLSLFFISVYIGGK